MTTEALADMNVALVRAIGLLSAEIKSGMDVDREALAEARDLVIEAYRDLVGLKILHEEARDAKAVPR